MAPPHRCIAGCGKVITWSFALCSECEQIYGNSPYNWPDWLRYLWQDIQRERRRVKRQAENEINYDFEMPTITNKALPHRTDE